MTIEEKVTKMNEMLAEINNLAKEINEEINKKQTDAKDMLDIYIKDIESGSTQYWLDSDGEVDNGAADYMSYNFNPYCNYNDDTFAEKAARMKKFTDILLAFKWCYDRNYEPDWSTNDLKYCIAYDFAKGQYDTCGYMSWLYSMVYFSSRDVAQKCVDWLNSIDPKGTLLLGTESNGKEASV